MSTDLPPAPPDPVVDAVLAFLNPREEFAAWTVLRQRSEPLFTDRAAAIMDEMLARYASADQDTLQNIVVRRQRLASARRQGIAAAYDGVFTPVCLASLDEGFENLPPGDLQRVATSNALLQLAEEMGDAARIDRYRHRLGLSLGHSALSRSPEERIHWLSVACQTIDRSASPGEWARAHQNLGESLRLDSKESGAIERAMACFERALEVFERSSYPAEWCRINISIGLAHLQRDAGDSVNHRDRAIERLEAVTTHEASMLKPRMRTHARRQLAEQLASRAEDSGVVRDAERAQEIAEQALKAIDETAEPYDVASLHALLAELLEKGADRANHAEHVIDRYEAALAAGGETPAWSGRKVLALQALGRLFEHREAGERAENLVRAVQCYEDALALNEAGHSELGAAVCSYWAGCAWSKRRDVPRELAAQTAIARFEAALARYPQDGPTAIRMEAHIELADALCSLAEGHRGPLVEEAIGHYEAARKLTDAAQDRAAWVRVNSGLGIALFERPHGDRARDIERAIQCQEAVIAVSEPAEHPRDWALAHHNLGNVHAERTTGSRRDNLERAIACFEAALTIFDREKTPEDWALSTSSLAGTLVRRIAGDQADNLERAISRFNQVLEVYTRDAFPADWAMTTHNLGLACLQRVEGDRDVNIDNGISALTRSLEVRTREATPYFWAMTQGNLGTAWMTRQVGDQAENARNALEHFRAAQEVYTRDAHPGDWAGIELALGASSLLPTGDDRIHALENALGICTRELQPERWALAQLSLGQVWAERDDPEAAGQALVHFERALEGLPAPGQPRYRCSALLGAGRLLMGASRWQAALDLFDEAIDIGERQREDAYTVDALLASAGELSAPYRESAWCLVELGRCADGLLRLEAGRARMLAVQLASDDVDLEALSSELRQPLVAARHTLRLLEAEGRESDADQTSAATADWNRMDVLFREAEQQQVGEATLYRVPLREARTALRGLGLSIDVANRLREARAALHRAEEAAFAACPALRPQPIDERAIIDLVPAGGALVTFTITSGAAIAWVLPAGIERVQPEHAVRLPPDTISRLQQHVDGSDDEPGWIDLLGASQHAAQDEFDENERDRRFSARTGELWPLVMGPIQARLESLALGSDNAILLVPQGALSLLPLHAAWRTVDGAARWFLDDHVVTYAPSFAAARAGRNRAREAARRSKTLLAIADTRGDLPDAREECTGAARCFGAAASLMLAGDDATEANVTASIAGRSHLHFATHGHYDGYDVMRSHLALGKRTRLSLARIVSPEVDLSRTLLVVLSACDSGLSEASRAPDEFLGLPGGFIQGGAAGVVSALWAIQDASTARLFDAFYRAHMAADAPIPDALRSAQQWLRHATVDELGLAQQWETVYRASPSGSPDAHAFGMMRWSRANPTARPYASPYHWAAFVFNGG